jgi:hypothetical protein
MTVDQYIFEQKPLIRNMLTILKTWILDLGPHAEQHIKYGIPYFYFYGQLCYLTVIPEAVSLCFAKGYALSDEDKILESKGRKQVKSVTFYSIASLEEHEESIRRLLNEAAILNEYQYKQRKRNERSNRI